MTAIESSAQPASAISTPQIWTTKIDEYLISLSKRIDWVFVKTFCSIAEPISIFALGACTVLTIITGSASYILLSTITMIVIKYLHTQSIEKTENSTPTQNHSNFPIIRNLKPVTGINPTKMDPIKIKNTGSDCFLIAIVQMLCNFNGLQQQIEEKIKEIRKSLPSTILTLDESAKINLIEKFRAEIQKKHGNDIDLFILLNHHEKQLSNYGMTQEYIEQKINLTHITLLQELCDVITNMQKIKREQEENKAFSAKFIDLVGLRNLLHICSKASQYSSATSPPFGKQEDASEALISILQLLSLQKTGNNYLFESGTNDIQLKEQFYYTNDPNHDTSTSIETVIDGVKFAAYRTQTNHPAPTILPLNPKGSKSLSSILEENLTDKTYDDNKPPNLLIHKKSGFDKPPKKLILTLSRFHEDTTKNHKDKDGRKEVVSTKYDKKVEMPIEFFMPETLVNSTTAVKYRLDDFIVHSGTINSGHYVYFRNTGLSDNDGKTIYGHSNDTYTDFVVSNGQDDIKDFGYIYNYVRVDEDTPAAI